MPLLSLPAQHSGMPAIPTLPTSAQLPWGGLTGRGGEADAEEGTSSGSKGDRGPVKKKRRHPVARIKGCWQASDDERLVRLVKEKGEGNWSAIARSFPGRIGKQCRERWHNQLRPNIKRDAWTSAEEVLLINAHKAVGNRWADIAKSIEGRTENSVKNHWNATLRRKDTSIEQDRANGIPTQLKEYMHALNLNLGKRKRPHKAERGRGAGLEREEQQAAPRGRCQVAQRGMRHSDTDDSEPPPRLRKTCGRQSASAASRRPPCPVPSRAPALFHEAPTLHPPFQRQHSPEPPPGQSAGYRTRSTHKLPTPDSSEGEGSSGEEEEMGGRGEGLGRGQQQRLPALKQEPGMLGRGLMSPEGPRIGSSWQLTSTDPNGNLTLQYAPNATLSPGFSPPYLRGALHLRGSLRPAAKPRSSCLTPPQASPYPVFINLTPTLSPVTLRSPLTKSCFSPLSKLPAIPRPGASAFATPELGADPELESAVQLLASGEAPNQGLCLPKLELDLSRADTGPFSPFSPVCFALSCASAANSGARHGIGGSAASYSQLASSLCQGCQGLSPVCLAQPRKQGGATEAPYQLSVLDMLTSSTAQEAAAAVGLQDFMTPPLKAFQPVLSTPHVATQGSGAWSRPCSGSCSSTSNLTTFSGRTLEELAAPGGISRVLFPDTGPSPAGEAAPEGLYLQSAARPISSGDDRINGMTHECIEVAYEAGSLQSWHDIQAEEERQELLAGPSLTSIFASCHSLEATDGLSDLSDEPPLELSELWEDDFPEV